MAYRLLFTEEAKTALKALEASPQHEKRLNKVRRTLGRIQTDPRHPGLNSHKYQSLHGLNNEEVWESYVENRTPSAWRVFWHYGPQQGVITVVIISPHP